MKEVKEFLESSTLILFDLDGTLIDSHDQIETALNVARVELGYGTSPLGQVFQKLGQPVSDLFIDLELNPVQQEQLISTFRSHLDKEIERNNICYPDVVKLIESIRFNEARIAIATSKQTLMAKKVVEHSLLNGLIDHVQGTDDFPPKPDPKVIKMCLDRFPGSRAIMIGDRTEDILAAKNAGISSIGIAQSAHSISELKRAGASYSFESIAELFAMVRG
jgi:phosphoglycolate phosphatase